MKNVVAFLYWLACGAILGLGLATVTSIGSLLIVLAVIFLAYGFKKSEHEVLWAAVVGFGVAPALRILVGGLTVSPCITHGDVDLCSYYPEGYIYFVALFAIIALIGLGWGFSERLHARI